MAEPRMCAVPGCSKPRKSRGWCSGHYARWRKHGDVGEAFLRRQPEGPPPCTIADCDGIQKGRGWCAKHYARWLRSGDDPTHPRIYVPAPGEPAGYYPTHQRVKRLRGKAADHRCAHCQSSARQWAYDNEDPNEVRDSKSRRYSLDPNHYLPLCTPCHVKFDAEYRERNGIAVNYPRGRRTPCGTRSAYNKWGCRCDACRAAQSAYGRAWRASA